MILQKNLFFGIYSLEVRLRMFNGLERVMSEVRASPLILPHVKLDLSDFGISPE